MEIFQEHMKGRDEVFRLGRVLHPISCDRKRIEFRITEGLRSVFTLAINGRVGMKVGTA